MRALPKSEIQKVELVENNELLSEIKESDQIQLLKGFRKWYAFYMKDITNYTSFSNLDIRVGKIVKVEDAETKKPTYRITVDFGDEIGTKVSCGAYRNYRKEDLIDKQVVGIVNLGAKQMGPEKSEILILGVPNEKGETIYLKPEQNVSLGIEVF